jgi:hypothetical protein
MPAAPVVAAVVVDYAIGEAVVAAVGSQILGATITGAIGGGLGAAATGGDVERGILGGAISGGVGSAISGALGATGSVGEFGPQIPEPSAIQTALPGVSRETARSLSKGLSSAGGRLAGALGTGSDISQALKQAGTAGIAGGLSDFAWGSTEKGDYASQAGKQATQYGISKLLAGPSTQYVGPSGSRDVSSPATTTGEAPQTPGPGSSALAQALRTDAGGPLFGGDSEGRQRRVWNVESLKLKDETGA